MLSAFWKTFGNQLIAGITAALVTYLDADRDTWIPACWKAKLRIYALTFILVVVNAIISFCIYPFLYPLLEESVNFPDWVYALTIGAGYFTIIRVISIRLQFKEADPFDLSFNNLIYERIQFKIFEWIDEIVDPFLEKEIKGLVSSNNLEQLAEKIYSRIQRANSRVLNSTQKEEAKQWLLDVLEENTSEARKKNLLAQVVITKKFPK